MFFHDDAQVLSQSQCQSLLASGNFGRISFTMRALPVIMPVTYGYLGGSVILGMNDGPARRAVAGGNVIALGVDNGNAQDPFWTVLAIGRAAEITERTQTLEFDRMGLTDLTGIPAQHYLQLQPDILTGYRTTSQP